jgi:hypothetical protein
MRSIRFSIAGLMAMVLLIALGFAALRNASDTVFAILLLVSRGVLGIAIVGAVCCSGARRAFWLGFAISGWIFIWCSLEPYPASPPLPTQTALFALGRAMGVPVDNPVLAHDRALMQTFFRVGQCVWSLIFAAAGGILARLLFGAAAAGAVGLAPGARAADLADSGKWWLRPCVVMGSGLIIVTTVAIAGARVTPGLWAGSTFYLTCVVLGIAMTCGSISGGKQRQAFLSAGVLGVSFLTVVFARSAYDAWPIRPTMQLLEDIQPWLPTARSESAGSAADVRIRRALERHIPMHFSEQTPLEELLRYVKEATADASGKGIPIYVDPLGLSEAERTMGSKFGPVKLDGVPLRVSLRLCLQQLDLWYVVKDGFLMVVSRDDPDEDAILRKVDAFQVAGHCVLALFAGVLGGLTAPFLCGLARKPIG